MKNKQNELQTSIDNVFHLVEDSFNKKGGFQPMFIFEFEEKDSKGKPYIKTGYNFILEDEELVNARFEASVVLGGAFALLELLGIIGKPTKVIIASEAWLSIQEEGGKMLPSQDPKKEEALVVSGSDSKNNTVGLIKIIKRKNKKISLETVKELEEVKGKKKKEKTLSSPILDAFWYSYKEKKTSIKQDEKYKEFIVEALTDPNGFFNFAINMATQGARLRYNLYKK